MEERTLIWSCFNEALKWAQRSSEEWWTHDRRTLKEGGIRKRRALRSHKMRLEIKINNHLTSGFIFSFIFFLWVDVAFQRCLKTLYYSENFEKIVWVKLIKLKTVVLPLAWGRRPAQVWWSSCEQCTDTEPWWRYGSSACCPCWPSTSARTQQLLWPTSSVTPNRWKKELCVVYVYHILCQ